MVIISGGNIDSDFALAFLKQRKPDLLLAADKGMEFCRAHGIIPHHLVGDFDSAGEAVLEGLPSQITIHRLRPEKDDSDTQSAVNLAISLGAASISILGATGTRLDHVMANLELLAYGLEQGVEISILDAHNRITAKKEPFCIRREEQFGNYLSFFPLGGPVEGLTLRGVKYSLTEHFLSVLDTGLTVSNEITEEQAEVTFSKGCLLVMETRD